MKKLPSGTQPEGPVTIRLNRTIQEQLDACAEKTGLKVTDLMRLCMRIGLEHFSRIDYNTAKCIVDAVENQKTAPTRPPTPPETKEKPAGKKNRFEVKELIVPDRSTTLLNEGATDAQREIESLQRRLNELTKETGSKTR